MASYILKSLLISLLFLLIYKVFLAKNQSYQFNRYFLLFALIASSLFPLFQQTIELQLEEDSILLAGNKAIEQIELTEYYSAVASNDASTNIWLSILGILYGLVCSLLVFRYLNNLKNLYAKNLTKGDRIDGFQVFYHRQETGIYSFFNRLYLPCIYEHSVLDESIIEHERAHYKQYHSIDNLIAQLYLIVFWFNPMVWIFNRQIKSNHEYLADKTALKHIKSSDYLQAILDQIKPKKALLLTSNFSYLSIKNRIKMIQKDKNNKLKKIISISLSLCIGVATLSLFAFKSNDIALEMSEQISENTGVEIFEKPSGMPIESKLIKKISSDYGLRTHPLSKKKTLHTGVDLVAPEGTKILSTAAGKVVKAEFSKNYGKHIVIQHNEKYSTQYAHLNSMNVKVGDQVKKSDIIGIIGNTGQSIATHLHYELIENGKKINPEITID